MYKCNDCKTLFVFPHIFNDYSDFWGNIERHQIKICPCCQSDSITYSDKQCERCEEYIFDEYYDNNNEIFCSECATEDEKEDLYLKDLYD